MLKTKIAIVGIVLALVVGFIVGEYRQASVLLGGGILSPSSGGVLTPSVIGSWTQVNGLSQCSEWQDVSTSTKTVVYGYISSTTWIVTSTKPSFCR